MHRQDYSNSPKVVDFLQQSANLITLLTDRGLLGLKSILAGKFFNERNTGILVILRNYIAQLDAIAALVLLPSTESIQSITRNLFEAKCYLDFVFERETEERSLAYQVHYIQERIKTLERFDSTTNRGTEFLAKLKKDKTLNSLEFSGINTKAVVDSYRAQLAEMPYRAMMEKIKSMTGKTDWFTVVGGGRSLVNLCEYLNCQFRYEFFYRIWSGAVHSSIVYQENIMNVDGLVYLEALRTLRGVQGTVNILVSMTSDLYIEIFKKTSQEAYERFLRCYKNQIQPKQKALDDMNIEFQNRLNV